MKTIRILTALVLSAALLAAPVCAAQLPQLSAKSAIVLDADTGQVLFEHNADEKRLIASTTKIMTALLVCRSGQLDEPFCVAQEATGVEGSSMYLRPGERVTARELLYGLLLHSGNDAALALALHVAGSEEEFVRRMNACAAQLGLRNTHFSNPHGLDSEQNYATARDLAELTRHALQNETFRQIVATRTATVADRKLTNHNRLLWRYDGAIGVKTGYTKRAGRILVSAAERCGRTLIAVTLNDPDDWREHALLLDYGFELYEKQLRLEKGHTVAALCVYGRQQPVRLVLREALSYSCLQQEQLRLRLVVPPFANAQQITGCAGALELWLDGRCVYRAALDFAQ